jgi:hypothetical protein
VPLPDRFGFGGVSEIIEMRATLRIYNTLVAERRSFLSVVQAWVLQGTKRKRSNTTQVTFQRQVQLGTSYWYSMLTPESRNNLGSIYLRFLGRYFKDVNLKT